MLTVVTAAATQHLTTLARAKVELGITVSTYDSQITAYISEASDLIAQYCGRDGFGRASYQQTERLTCDQDYILLDRDIAPEITAVTVDGVAVDAADYELDGSFLYKLTDDERTYWDAGKTIIEYDAGFELLGDLPYALERACLDLVVNLYRGAGRDSAVRMDSVEGVGSTAYFDVRSNAGAMPLSDDRLRALDRYKVVAVG